MNRLNAKMRKESLGYTNYAEFSYEAFMKTSKNAEKERKEAAEAKRIVGFMHQENKPPFGILIIKRVLWGLDGIK